MPYRPNPRRPLPVQLSALHLTGSIALGMWLGFLAIALTCWLLSQFVENQLVNRVFVHDQSQNCKTLARDFSLGAV